MDKNTILSLIFGYILSCLVVYLIPFVEQHKAKKTNPNAKRTKIPLWDILISALLLMAAMMLVTWLFSDFSIIGIIISLGLPGALITFL